MNNYMSKQIQEEAGCLRRLSDIYGKWNYNEILRHQLLESARVIDDIIGNFFDDTDVEKEYRQRIKRKLLCKGIKSSDIVFKYNDEHRVTVGLIAWVKSGCCRSELMINAISEILGRNMTIPVGCRNIVSTVRTEYVFVEESTYQELHGSAVNSKYKTQASGDTYTFVYGKNNKFIMSIVDGMGTGELAARDSAEVMDFIEEYSEAGFDFDTIPKIINDALVKQGKERPVTLDLAEIDLNTGDIKISKAGGATTFIKKSDKVDIIFPCSMPLGILNELNVFTTKEKLCCGDYVIMVSDGVIDSLPYYDKEKKMAEIIGDIKENNPDRMAHNILNECCFFNEDQNIDDMTVIVVGIWENSLQR